MKTIRLYKFSFFIIPTVLIFCLTCYSNYNLVLNGFVDVLDKGNKKKHVVIDNIYYQKNDIVNSQFQIISIDKNNILLCCLKDKSTFRLEECRQKPDLSDENIDRNGQVRPPICFLPH
jgi:hypothetical protein